jgi:hypothetical protein
VTKKEKMVERKKRYIRTGAAMPIVLRDGIGTTAEMELGFFYLLVC